MMLILAGFKTDAAAPPTAAELPDAPYGWEISTLAQRYYGQCRTEMKVRDQMARDFNERHLSEPPFRSFRSGLSPADRRDAELVCLGAAMQQLDDREAGAPGASPGVGAPPAPHARVPVRPSSDKPQVPH